MTRILHLNQWQNILFLFREGQEVPAEIISLPPRQGTAQSIKPIFDFTGSFIIIARFPEGREFTRK